MKTKSSGFSLIELMIAVAIISVLLSIAIPSYMMYMAKAKTVAGKSELSSLHTVYENRVIEGSNMPTLDEIGANTLNSAHCVFALNNAQDGSALLACALISPPYLITGGIISYLRSPTGTWTCQVNAAIGATYAPNGCSVGG